MTNRKFSSRSLAQVVLLFLLANCATPVKKPCSTGGQPAREPLFKGTKQCVQIRDANGGFVNDGQYVEWFETGKPALEGRYKKGLKEGKWIEYNEKGQKVSEKYFDKGKEVPTRTSIMK